MQRLTDQVAIVTGGAQGVGRGIASVLAAEGARVVIVRRRRRAGRVDGHSVPGGGRETFAVTADVTDRASVEAMAARVVAEHGRIDILAANAGVYPTRLDRRHRRRDLGSGDGHQRQGRASTSSRRALPTMVARRYGRIVLTSSITGPVTGQPGFAHYGASKAAMLGFMRSAAVELATSGVTINAVLPGNVETPGFADTSDEHQRQMLLVDPDGALRGP